jgi:invasion protein IalB
MTFSSFSIRTLVSAVLISSAFCATPIQAEEQPAAVPAVPDVQQPLGAAGAQQPVRPARVQKFDDWYYRCVDGKAADGAATAHCEVAQVATVKQGDQDVNILTLAIAKTTDATVASNKKPAKQQASELVLTALVPLNMYLPAGLGISAADKRVAQLAYRNCNQAGCWSQQKLDNKMMSALTKAADGTGHVEMMNGQKVNIKFSLKGLSAALGALQKTASN